MVNGLKCIQKDFKIDAIFDRKLVELLERGEVVDGGGHGDDRSGGFLEKLKLMDGFLSKAK